jgi:hypothetical protein
MADLIHPAIPAFLLLVLAEAIAGAVMHRDLYESKDAAASLTMGLGNVLVSLVGPTAGRESTRKTDCRVWQSGRKTHHEWKG